MRYLPYVLIALITTLQYPLWFGKGSWLQVRQLEHQLTAQQQTNQQLQARNDALAAEVSDLKDGLSAIEERARDELGMVMPNEIYYQVVNTGNQAMSAPTPGTAPAH